MYFIDLLLKASKPGLGWPEFVSQHGQQAALSGWPPEAGRSAFDAWLLLISCRSHDVLPWHATRFPFWDLCGSLSHGDTSWQNLDLGRRWRHPRHQRHIINREASLRPVASGGIVASATSSSSSSRRLTAALPQSPSSRTMMSADDPATGSEEECLDCMSWNCAVHLASALAYCTWPTATAADRWRHLANNLE